MRLWKSDSFFSSSKTNNKEGSLPELSMGDVGGRVWSASAEGDLVGIATDGGFAILEVVEVVVEAEKGDKE